MIYEQTPVQLKVALVSAPPITPIDENTGLAPAFWRASGARVNFGLFDNTGAPVDLSNLAYLQFILQQAVDSATPLIVKTVLAVDIIPLITLGDWNDQVAQNAAFILSAAEMDQSLQAQPSAGYWMIVQGMTSTNVPITYSAGPVTLYASGGTIPTPNLSYVSQHDSANNALNQTIQPTSQIHTETITVGGVARTQEIALALVGMSRGAQLNLLFLLPSTADVILRVRNGTVGGTLLSTVNTNAGVLQWLLKYYFDGSAWQKLEATVPAY